MFTELSEPLEIQVARIEERVAGEVRSLRTEINGLGERISGELRNVVADYRFADREIVQQVEDVREQLVRHEENGGHKQMRLEVAGMRKEIDTYKAWLKAFIVGATLNLAGIGWLIQLVVRRGKS